LLFSAWMNIKNVRETITYKIWRGDKETYWLAFELAGIPYYFAEGYAGSIGISPGNKTICTGNLLHTISTNCLAWFNGLLKQIKRLKDTDYVSFFFIFQRASAQDSGEEGIIKD